jgi:hypothetical protein
MNSAGARLLRRLEAASYLGVSTAQLDLLRAMGELMAIAMPGRRGEPIRTPLYDRLDLDAAIARWKTRERAS